MSDAAPSIAAADHEAELPALVTLRYGELVTRFESTDGRTRFRIPPEYREFVIENGAEPHCTVSWSTGPLDLPNGTDEMGGDVWAHRVLPDGSDETVFYRTMYRIPWAVLRFAPDLTRADVRHDPVALGSEFADVGLYPLSEIMASRLLCRLDAVDLHASAAVIDGRAYLFCGHSGAGKTTISELALRQGATILSDDRTIVGVRNGVGIAWGTPWHGSGRRSSSRTAPIAGIFLIVQAGEERAERVSPARAFKELFVRLIHQRLTRQESEAALSTLESLVAAVPVWELRFRPVPEAIETAVRAAAEERGA